MLCGAISAKCYILHLRIPLYRSLHEIKREWKLEQEIEKRVPVVLQRLLCLLLFPQNMPVVYNSPDVCVPSNKPHSPWGENSSQTCNTVLPMTPLMFQSSIILYCWGNDLAVVWHLAPSVHLGSFIMRPGWLWHFKGHAAVCTQQLVYSLVFLCGLQTAR